jgi:hypothetical protein
VGLAAPLVRAVPPALVVLQAPVVRQVAPQQAVQPVPVQQRQQQVA